MDQVVVDELAWVNRIIETRLVSADELLANPKNWRKHPAGQAKALVGVLEKIGIVTPLLAYYSERAGGALTLIDGHLRLEQGGVWPCTIVNLSDEEADYVLLTHDPLTAMAYGDPELLEDLLRSVEVDGEAVKTMLDGLAREVGVNLDDLDEIDDAEVDINEADALGEKWGVRPGDVWECGSKRHRLMCGDSTSAEDVETLLGMECPILMVTDPPYGVEYDPNWRNEAAEAGWLAYAPRRVGEVVNDDRVDWSAAYKLFPGDVAYTWSPGGDLLIATGAALQDANFQIRNQIIWKKPHFPIGRGHYTYQHEPCWYAVKKGAKAHWIGDARASTVWEVALDKNVEGGHSTQKPLECMSRPMRNHEGDVYDPFMGSGTSLIAAEGVGRRCYGMEINPGYVGVALERFRNATGQLPVKVIEGTAPAASSLAQQAAETVGVEGVAEHAETPEIQSAAA